MKHLQLFTMVMAVSFILLTGCEKDFKGTSVTSGELKQTALAPSAHLSVALKAKLARLRASLPAGSEKRMKLSSTLFLQTHPEFREMVNRALKITPTPCDDDTPLFQWLFGQELADWDDDAFFYVNFLGMLGLPADLAYVFENSSDNQYFGVKGEYTQILTKTFKDLKRFWNIQSNDIVMVAMHGKMMYNRERVVLLYQLYGNPLAISQDAADLVIQVLDEIPQYRKGDHPIFTFNAFASSEDFIPPVGAIPKKITIGDGVLDGYAGIGFDDVAPQAVLAHEYGHHIQLQLDLFEDEESPEATRRTELMADAFSAYFMSHARGASMQWKRVKQFLEVFFNIGDCAFTNNGHHGTPTQRMAAAEWGYSVANDAQKQGHILTAQEFAARFDAHLPEIIAH